MGTMLRSMCSWGEKVVIAGAIVSSAPFVVPPLLLLSALGFAVSVPFSITFVGYACMAKILKSMWVGGPYLSSGNTNYTRGADQSIECSNLQQKSLKYLPREEVDRGVEGEDFLREEEIESETGELEEVEPRACAPPISSFELLTHAPKSPSSLKNGKSEWVSHGRESMANDGEFDEDGAVAHEIGVMQSGEETEEKSSNEEWEGVGKEMVGEGNWVSKYSHEVDDSGRNNYDHEPSSTDRESCAALPASSSEVLTNIDAAQASLGDSSVEFEVLTERNDMYGDSLDKDVFDEEKLWAQLEALRMIVDYREALEPSFLHGGDQGAVCIYGRRTSVSVWRIHGSGRCES